MKFVLFMFMILFEITCSLFNRIYYIYFVETCIITVRNSTLNVYPCHIYDPSVNIANLIVCFSLVIMFVLLKLVIMELEIY